MTYEDLARFIGENPVCSIATMDGDQPRVRKFLTILYEGEPGPWFTTGTMKSVGRQLEKNPKVELCYVSPDFATMLRVTGIVEFVDDMEKKRQLYAERDYLKAAFDNPADPAYKLLHIAHGSAKFWSLADNMKEDSLEVIEF
jgi:pyridoxamine 5'-phosphate oxidase